MSLLVAFSRYAHLQNPNMDATQYHEDDFSSLQSIRKKSSTEKKAVRFFVRAGNPDEEASDVSYLSNVSKFSFKAIRDEVSSKLKLISQEQEGGRDPPPMDDEAGFELLPNCDEDGNSSIVIARAANDYLNRAPPLQTRKAKIKRMFKRKNQLDVIATVEECGGEDDNSTLLSEESSLYVCRKMPSTSSVISNERVDEYQRRSIDSKELDDNQWKELFEATQKMVYYFLGQIMEEQEVKELEQQEELTTQKQEKPVEPLKKHIKWARIARKQSYNTIKSLKTKAKTLSLPTALPMPKSLPIATTLAMAKSLPMPKPILKVGSIQKLRESFFRDAPEPIVIEVMPPLKIAPITADRYQLPESNSLDEEVEKAIDTFRMHASRLGVNERELMNAVQQDERSLRAGFIADDTDRTVITYGPTYQRYRDDMEGEEDDGATVYTRATLDTYAPTIADSEYTPYTFRERDENLFMVKLVDVFDYYFAP